MPAIPAFSSSLLRSICDILGATDTGLTNREIDMVLGEARIADTGQGLNKRDRLFSSLSSRQAQDRCANNVIAFLKTAMAPVRWAQNPERFQSYRQQLNTVLAFAGLALGEDGQMRRVTAARTLTEAQERAGRLQKLLTERGVHADVIRFCRAELLQDNCFHAVLEATKSVAEKIRERTGLVSDGAPLVDEAFGLAKGNPLLAFNSLRTDTDKSAHTGLTNIMKGMFGAFRNPTGHAPRISWPLSERDALDLLTLASLLHRRLDDAVSALPRTA